MCLCMYISMSYICVSIWFICMVLSIGLTAIDVLMFYVYLYGLYMVTRMVWLSDVYSLSMIARC